MKTFKHIITCTLLSISGVVFAQGVAQNSNTYLNSLQQNPSAQSMVAICNSSAQNAMNGYKTLHPDSDANTLKTVQTQLVNQCVYGQHTDTAHLSVPTVAQLQATKKQLPNSIQSNIY